MLVKEKNFLKNIQFNASKLENKLKTAKENTDRNFDLSNIKLRNIPSTTFGLCKSLKKECLFLQQNHLSYFGEGNALTDLENLKVLDISFNKFTELPQDIGALRSLEVLKANNNSLQELPKQIGSLKNLKDLDVSRNNLKVIPQSLGNCANLTVLNLKHNKHLTELPITFGRLKNLKELVVDNTVIFPPRDVLQGGPSATTSFLAKELHDATEGSQSKYSLNGFKRDSPRSVSQEKRKTFLAIGEELKSNFLREIELHNQSKRRKSQLVTSLKQDQDDVGKALAKVQEQKGTDRDMLIKSCEEEEKKFNETLTKILKNNRRIQSQVVANYNKEMKEDLEKLLRESSNLNKKDKKFVLDSMDEVVKSEFKKSQENKAGRQLVTVKSVLTELARQDESLQDILKKHEKTQKEIIKTLKDNEVLQKSAVASLIERNDALSWAVKEQIMIVEQKLIELTRLELSKKKLQSKELMAELNHNRSALTKVLLDLFDQQDARRQVLVDTLRRMEFGRTNYPGGQGYWLEQYKNILDSKSTELVTYFKSVDPLLVGKFFEYGVFQFLPILKDAISNDEALKKLDVKALAKLGIESEDHRRGIIHAIESYFAVKSSRRFGSSSKDSEELEGGILKRQKKSQFRYIVPEECVICLSARPNVVFIPCGHVCCCFRCFSSIALCPICRAPIDTVQKVLTTAEE